MRKGKINRMIIVLIFILGMVIFTYPLVGNWLSSRAHDTVIRKHQAVLAEMSSDDLIREKEKALSFNEGLAESAIAFVDPFSDEASPLPTARSYYQILDVGSAMGTIEIPSIEVELPIYHGVDDRVLSQGIGHLSNSSFPVGGLGTHTALTGHRGLPSATLFRDLDKLEEKDVFFIHTLNESLAYQVDEIQVVMPTETAWLEMKEDKDYVTLITCEPYMLNTHRLLVRGERIAYEVDLVTDQVKKGKNPLQYLELFFIIVGVSIFLLFFLTHLNRAYRRKG